MKRPATILSIVLPAFLLIIFAIFPNLDIASPQPILHFYLVIFFTYVAIVAALLVAITLGANSPARHQLLATAGIAMGIIFFVHGVTTPGALTYTFNPGIRWGAWLTLFVGSMLFLLASVDRIDKPLQRHHLRLINIVILIICAVFCLIVTFLPEWLRAVDERIAPWHERTAYILTLIAWLVAAWQLRKTWHKTGSHLDGVMALIATWLALATVSQNEFSVWQLSWWIYHFLLLFSAITAVYYLLGEYEQTRQFSLTRYYAVTSLIVMAALTLLISFVSSYTVQREREAFLHDHIRTLSERIVSSFTRNPSPEAVTAELNAIAMASQSLNLLAQGQLLSINLDNVLIYSSERQPIYQFLNDDSLSQVQVNSGRYQLARAGTIDIHLRDSTNRTAANIPTTIIQAYVPLQTSALPDGVLLLQQEVAGLNESVLQARRNSLFITFTSMTLLFLALLGLVRRAEQLITTRNNELAQAYADLQAAEAIRDDLTDMIVHDLRSPLTAIEISLQLLLKPTAHTEKNQNRLLTNAHHSLQQAIGLINDILDVAKLEASQLNLSLDTIEINQFLKDRLRLYSIYTESERKNILLVPLEQPLQLQADPKMLARVLDNLISNALKYIRAGGHVRVTAYRQTNSVQIAVADDGVGISPENASRIFDKFVQVKNESGAVRRGTGLGLTFCRLTIEAHGGHIWVESELGKGSTFYFTLPL